MKLKDYSDRKISNIRNVKFDNWRFKKITKYINKNNNFLDVGCASGILSILIKKKKANYYGIDYNQYFVDFCKKKKLNVKQCDISSQKLPFPDNFFDIVYCSHVIEHVNTKEQLIFMKDLSRIVKKGGVVFIAAPTPYHWYFWDDETHIRPCTHGQLSKLAKNFDFKIIEAKYSRLRFFSNNMQKFLRLPPIRWGLWETYIIVKKIK